MELERIWWLVTVGACLITVLILFIEGYVAYGEVTLAVAASAAVNLL